MTNSKRLPMSTIVLGRFKINAAGHGIAGVGHLEIAGLCTTLNIGTEDFSLSLIEPYDKSLSSAALFALVGHLFLIISILTKNIKKIFWTKIIGLIFLWASFYYLTHNIFNDDLSQIGFVTGLPFLIVSIMLVIKVTKQRYQSAYG